MPGYATIFMITRRLWASPGRRLKPQPIDIKGVSIIGCFVPEEKGELKKRGPNPRCY
jgi:hypothetical protein